MFTYFTPDTAPPESGPQIQASIAAFGFFPKLHQILAAAPATYETYNRAFELFQSNTTLSPLEQQIVMMTANFENRCHYCTAGHSMLMKMAKMPVEIIEALREGQPLADPKLEILRSFTRQLIETRGHVGDDMLRLFLEAGYDQRQALEILTGLAAKLISNFTNALAHTELDEPIKALAWTHPADRNPAAA
ncbi:carboxymuconolactone decarboxylase family protein [Labrys okinawensis]|uniref:carboxymuconolactone decarboxylase family protein n=1 Tax=Labrys okinawensis TaxID=346911 RepID=UPI0039BCD8FD